MTDNGTNPGDSLAGQIGMLGLCMQDYIAGLSHRQLGSLHLFKHELIALLFKLYETTPAEKADPVLRKIMAQLNSQFPPP